MEWLQKFLLCFIPLFVAMDCVGIAPLFASLTDGLTDRARRQLITQATGTAFAIAVVFLMLGKVVFSFLGITEGDFRIAGGLVLLILAITDLLFSKEEERRSPRGDIGVVPIGIPLIMGPAALTTILILLDSYGYVLTLASLFANLIIVWLIFRYCHQILKVFGTGGSKAVAKVGALFLAAIGIMMIRVGIEQALKAFTG